MSDAKPNGNQFTQDNDERVPSASFQPAYTAVLNLSSTPSIKQMENESFKPDFVDELPKEERTPLKETAKRDLPTSESATILINSMNNSRMFSSQKAAAAATNRTDGDVIKFEDELDFRAANSSTSTTPKPEEEEETLGKKLKKKHLQMMQLKKKLKNSPNKFAAIKIRAPRLQFSNASTLFAGDKQARRHKIGYASLVRTRNVNLTDYHSDEKHFVKVSCPNRKLRSIASFFLNQKFNFPLLF